MDQIAAEEGFGRWSLLAASAVGSGAAGMILAALKPGDLLIVAARPGQGKTLLGLGLAAEAMVRGGSATMFSLAETAGNAAGRFHSLGWEPQRFDTLFRFDGSDDICADYIAHSLATAPRGLLVVIDYLQLLDQRRETPALMDQVRHLRAFAGERGLILVFLSQVDRSFEAAGKPFPALHDIRRPNPLDLSLFDKACFLGGGEARFETLRPSPA